MSYRRTLFRLPFLCFLFSPFAEPTTTGNVRGAVSDLEANPLPGATVTITSNALMGRVRTTYTNDLGVFRFPSLPVGVLKLLAIAESMTVVGETSVLDTTDSGFSCRYKKEMLEEVPTQHNFWDVIHISPGMSQAVGDSFLDRTVAFGSNDQSNSWNMDGLEVSGPLTGSSWWFVNPDIVEEVQVLGIGAPAEYGNHTGAVFNVITKKGGNDYHGAANFFYETDALTGVNVRLPDSPYPFHRDSYRHLPLQTGGPISKDRIWFFGGFQHLRDASSQPGNDPDFANETNSDKYDFKTTSRIGQKNEVNAFIHHEQFNWIPFAAPNIDPSATCNESGGNPAWGGGLISTISQNLLLELNYAGWSSDDLADSATGSREDPFIDFTPPNGGPATYSGGLLFPVYSVTGRHQFNGKITYYAEQFLKSQHEFRFGVQYAKGWVNTDAAIGPNGTYSYNYSGYLYKAVQNPYQYGGDSHDLGFVVDDTVTVNDRLTLNLGIRFDHNTGGIPDYEDLTVGTPSVSPAGNFKATGEKIPGVADLITWNLLSPRIGFVYQPRGNARSVIHGSFGTYYDHNVIGNWDFPPPGLPTLRVFNQNPDTGEFELFREVPRGNIAFNKGLRPPHSPVFGRL